MLTSVRSRYEDDASRHVDIHRNRNGLRKKPDGAEKGHETSRAYATPRTKSDDNRSRKQGDHDSNNCNNQLLRDSWCPTDKLMPVVLVDTIIGSFGTSLEKLVFMPKFCKISSGT